MRPRLTALLVATVLLVAAACGSDGGSSAETTGTTEKATTTTLATPLEILVTNDDGYSAEGIDALVEGLRTLPNVKVTVVAPSKDNTGTGGKTTDGPLTAVDGKTISGYPATAVVGFPADTIRYALEDMRLTPDLVVAGINKGQNLAAAVDASGTIGAARAAAAKGIPALAASQGLAAEPDYLAGVRAVLTWITEHRDGLEGGTVTSLNIPTCSTGEVRGSKVVPVAPPGGEFDPVDCTSTLADPANDKEAFRNGWVSESMLPLHPG